MSDLIGSKIKENRKTPLITIIPDWHGSSKTFGVNSILSAVVKKEV
jgi:hypothetical protein